MEVKTYDVAIRGLTPLLLHADNIEWADQMKAWSQDNKNSKKSVAGDDRTPAHRWIGCLHNDGDVVAVPQEMLASAFMKAGSRVQIPGGKGGKTFKQDTMALMSMTSVYVPLVVGGKTIPWAGVEKLIKEENFSEHQAATAKMGFSLFIKRAKVGTSKHVRVRPMFKEWGLALSISVWDEVLEKKLEEIIGIAGRQIGIGDWRPSAPQSPGPYGRFEIVKFKKA